MMMDSVQNHIKQSMLIHRGVLLVALSAILYGTMAYFGTKLFQLDLTVENMLFWRFFMATIWMSISIIFFIKKYPIKQNNHSGFTKLTLFCAITYSGSTAFYFIASKQIGTGVAMAIFFAYPLFVTLFASLFSHWRMNRYAFLSLLAVLIGLQLLRGQGNQGLNTYGILLAIFAGACYAIYIYTNQNSAKKIDSRLLTLLICSGNAVIFLAISIYTHRFFMPTSIEAWLYIVALGIIATALPIQLMLDGLKYISPIKASILSVLEPLVTVMMGIMLLDEVMLFSQLLGVLILLVGAILIQFEKNHVKEDANNDVEPPIYAD